MVNLPSILAVSVTIESPTYPSSTLVFAPRCRVVTADNLRFVPDGQFCFIAECHKHYRFGLYVSPSSDLAAARNYKGGVVTLIVRNRSRLLNYRFQMNKGNGIL